MLMDVEKGTTVIFEPAQAGRTAQVYGPNLLSLPAADREALGYKVVLPVSDLDTALSYALARGGHARSVAASRDFPIKPTARVPKLDATMPGNSRIPITSRFRAISPRQNCSPNATPWRICAI